MNSFELVNHRVLSLLTKIKHLFGGIEAQKNSSIEHLDSQMKKIQKCLQKAQQSYKKIYTSLYTIKTNLIDLTQNYLSISKQSTFSSTILTTLTNEINNFITDLNDQSYALAGKMENKMEYLIPSVRKLKEKYDQKEQKLEHYKQKMELLEKGIQNQSKANVSQDQFQRYERVRILLYKNRQKLRNATKQYDACLIKMTKKYVQFNSQSVNELHNDLLSFFSTFGGNIITSSHTLTNMLVNKMNPSDLCMAKFFKNEKQKSFELDQIILQENSPQKIVSFIDAKQQETQFITIKKMKYYNKMVQDRQINKYISNAVNKETSKPKKLNSINTFLENKPQNTFKSFTNNYTTPSIIKKQQQRQKQNKHAPDNSNSQIICDISQKQITTPRLDLLDFQDSVKQIKKDQQSGVSFDELTIQESFSRDMSKGAYKKQFVENIPNVSIKKSSMKALDIDELQQLQKTQSQKMVKKQQGFQFFDFLKETKTNQVSQNSKEIKVTEKQEEDFPTFGGNITKIHSINQNHLQYIQKQKQQIKIKPLYSNNKPKDNTVQQQQNLFKSFDDLLNL